MRLPVTALQEEVHLINGFHYARRRLQNRFVAHLEGLALL